jgi:hypothetical protein
VAEENWPLLEQAYQRSSQNTPPGLEQSFLVQGIEDKNLWQLIFRETDAEATHAVFEVVQHRVAN